MNFATDNEVIRYVEQQLKSALPVGWGIEGSGLCWRLIPAGSPPGGLDDFRLRVAGDRMEFILEHDNTDAGPMGLHLFLLRAHVMRLEALEYYSLADAVREVIRTCAPNRWGLT